MLHRSRKIEEKSFWLNSGSSFALRWDLLITFILYYVLVSCTPESVTIYWKSTPYAITLYQNKWSHNSCTGSVISRPRKVGENFSFCISFVCFCHSATDNSRHCRCTCEAVEIVTYNADFLLAVSDSGQCSVQTKYKSKTTAKYNFRAKLECE